MQPDNRELGRGVRHRTGGQTQAWSDKPTLHDARIVDDLKRGCRPEVDDDEREPVELFCGNAIRHTIGAEIRRAVQMQLQTGFQTRPHHQRTHAAKGMQSFDPSVGKPGDNGGHDGVAHLRIAAPDLQKRLHAQKRLVGGQAIRGGHAPSGRKGPFTGQPQIGDGVPHVNNEDHPRSALNRTRHHATALLSLFPLIALNATAPIIPPTMAKGNQLKPRSVKGSCLMAGSTP